MSELPICKVFPYVFARASGTLIFKPAVDFHQEWSAIGGQEEVDAA